MAKLGRLWRLAPVNTDLRDRLSQELAVSPIVAQVLINRGITNAASGREFLHGGLQQLNDPAVMKDMSKSVQRIASAIGAKEKITIYGDYDVDGITASALMVRMLSDLGAVVEYYIPERQSEGYGLNGMALDQLVASGTKLLITVDCGISAVRELAAIKGKLEVIITDHHQPPDVLPEAYAILNPKQPDCLFPHKQLAGVGVAFKLCQALWRYYRPQDTVYQLYLDIVALGTIADIVPLTGENRILVKLGLAQMQHTQNVGLKALQEVCGIAGQKMDTGKVGFVLAPRLNAAGRISHAAAGVELLTTSDPQRAQELALLLNLENTTRQEVEREILIAADQLAADMNPMQAKVLVVVGSNWHPGVIGIVASRLVEKYYRPVVMITIKDGIGKGSCRSISGFDMYEALKSAADLLIQYGGHKQAAGLTIEVGNIAAFQQRLTQFAATTMKEEDYIPKIHIDTLIAIEEVDSLLLEQIACLEPYGMSNPSPVFASRRLKVAEIRAIGQDGRHIKLKINRNNTTTDVLGWDMGELSGTMNRNDYIDLAFIPEFNDWQGLRSIQFRAHDVRTVRIENQNAVESLFSPKMTGRFVELIQADWVIGDCVHGLLDSSNWTDLRHGSSRMETLKQLLSSGNRTVIYVTQRFQAVALAGALREQLPELAEYIGYYHGGLPATLRRKVLDWFASGEQKIVVVSGCFPYEEEISGVSIVLYHLPLTPMAFFQYCRQSQSVSLLFDRTDMELNERCFQDVAPERAVIGQVYLILKAVSKRNRPFRYSAQAIAEAAYSRSAIPISVPAVEKSLKILTELGLINSQNEEGKLLLIQLAEAPESKLNLEQSATFRNGRQERQHYQQFAQVMLETAVDQLIPVLMKLKVYS